MTQLRLAIQADIASVYAICLATADAGQDAGAPGRQGELYGHLYAGPYLDLAPRFAWVAEDGEGVCAYALATDDSSAFYARMEAEWLPPLRRQYQTAISPLDQGLLDRLHAPFMLDPRLADWPGHLHIDLLPRCQGRGLGGCLMERILAGLAEASVPAVHLGVDPRNVRALGWYGRFGFTELFRQPGCVWMGKQLR